MRVKKVGRKDVKNKKTKRTQENKKKITNESDHQNVRFYLGVLGPGGRTKATRS